MPALEITARTAVAAAAAMQREAVGLVLVAVRPVLLRRLGLRRAPGDEGRQCVRAYLRLRRTRLLAEVRLTFARLIRLIVALHEGLRIRRDERLRLARAERLVAGERRFVLAVVELLVVALKLLVVAALGPRLEVRIVLAELLLRRRDQAEIMFGVLEIIFRRDRIAGRLGVTRKLEIFIRDVIGRAANLHVRAVGFINPCQGILIAPIIVLLIVAPAHALVVMMLLTVSHGLLFNHS